MRLHNGLLGNEAFSAINADVLILTASYTLIMIFGVTANLTVLLAVTFSKSLQPVSNVFIVTLAVADLLTCLVLPVFILSLLTEYQPNLDRVCFAALAVGHTTIGCSIFTLASIAVNRFVLFIGPINRKYYRAITKRSVFVIWITLLWIIPLFVSIFPPVALNIGKLSFDEKHHICRSHSSYPTSEIYDSLLIYVFYPLPVALLLIAHTGIFVQVLRHNRRLAKYTENLPMSPSERASCSEPQVHARKPTRRISKLQMKITRNMFTIFVAFSVCLTPHLICNFMQCQIAPYTRTLITFSSMVNPILYGISHPDFREFYCKLFRCQNLVE